MLSDSLPPWIQWVSPESNVTVDSIVGLIVRAGDENGIWRIVFSIGGFEYSPDSVAGEYYYYTWNCRRFPEGPYPVVSRAWDAARNSAITPVRMVEVKH